MTAQKEERDAMRCDAVQGSYGVRLRSGIRPGSMASRGGGEIGVVTSGVPDADPARTRLIVSIRCAKFAMVEQQKSPLLSANALDTLYERGINPHPLPHHHHQRSRAHNQNTQVCCFETLPDDVRQVNVKIIGGCRRRRTPAWRCGVLGARGR